MSSLHHHQSLFISVAERLRTCLQREALEDLLCDFDPPALSNDASPPLVGAFVNCVPTRDHCDLGVPPTPVVNQRKQKQKERSSRRRRERREAEQSRAKTNLKATTIKRRIKATHVTFKTGFHLDEDAKVSNPGWTGKRRDGPAQRAYTKEELVNDFGMTYIPWDGVTPHSLLDREGCVIGILAGQPRDQAAWTRVHDVAFERLQSTASRLQPTWKESHSKRGPFPSVAHGISFGGGQKEPSFLSHSPSSHEILEEVMEDPSIQRICAFGSRAYEIFNERSYTHMKMMMELLHASRDASHDEKRKLRRPYDKKVGIFPCRSFNLGVQSTSYPHLDEGNLPNSWCCITPLGRFNPQTGGHLVLWDLLLLIKFPPGSTILIPSALIFHSNTSIKEGEVRFSLIQYAAGGLFRWVDNSFKTAAASRRITNDLEVLERCKLVQDARWTEAMKMFTHVDELAGKEWEMFEGVGEDKPVRA